MINHAPNHYHTFRKSRFSVSRLIGSSSRSKPIIACCPSPLPRSFIPWQAFRCRKSVSAFALANTCSISSIPMPSMTLRPKAADIQAFQSIFTMKVRRLRLPCPRYAWCVWEIRPNFLLWPYLCLVEAMHPEPPIWVGSVGLLIG